jgi:hypothetical protein
MTGLAATDLTSPHGHAIFTIVVLSHWYLVGELNARHYGSSLATRPRGLEHARSACSQRH